MPLPGRPALVVIWPMPLTKCAGQGDVIDCGARHSRWFRGPARCMGHGRPEGRSPFRSSGPCLAGTGRADLKPPLRRPWLFLRIPFGFP